MLINNFGYIIRYWGKAQKNIYSDADYHLLAYHCLDVAAVGKYLLAPHKKITADIADFLELSKEELQNLFVFFLLLHDIGKFASAFQQLYSPEQHAELLKPQHCKPYDGKHFRHDRLGLFFWKQIQDGVLFALVADNNLQRRDKDRAQDTLMVLMQCMLGHHGKPIDDGDDWHAIGDFTEDSNVTDAKAFTNDLIALFQVFHVSTCLSYTNPLIKKSGDFFESFSTLLISITTRLLRDGKMFYTHAEQWADETFSRAKLGDRRRTKRLIKFTASLANHIGQSIVRSMQNRCIEQSADRLYQFSTTLQPADTRKVQVK
ncbi:CRISPR-associated endonuclease Cas3'' [Xenorhabdus bovienii]|uniref:CRISPR-associated endonuclease Cas3 n=1 Tax=Xenorhabdus bovienii TaxID=40576 RepID=A0AAJ1J9V0_XENBV|nr:CRISPR-associated endonuclease Cas3'' [Xenorhabdus bovienii]MDE9510111.1 CRISPR-associated endonuclease Cas3'' [Xenorhabdus bovienii]MDE9521753.1 CRISPR-associated endonuclease Cas3'' [Xenorhabdus bovienii]